MNISLEKINLYRALGELAYIMARNDGVITQVEKIVFREAIKEELGQKAWAALDRFEHLDGGEMNNNLEQAYNRALFSIRQNIRALDEETLEKFIGVLEKVGGVSGISEDEIIFIERVREDIQKMS